MSVSVHRLSNGLRIAVEPMPSLHSAAVGVYVTAGGRHERLEQCGVAHFLEHMAFKGTPSRSAQRIAEEIEDVGGYINAYTDKEITAYFARVLEDDVDRAFGILADILLHPLFAEADIEVERGVILQEIGQSLDTPDDVIFDWLQETAYPDQPFGRPILGPAERVAGFSRTDLSGFVTEHYRPDQLIVTAAGAVDPDAILRAAERHFGALEAGPPAVPGSARFAAGERRGERPLEQVHAAFAFESVPVRDPAAPAAQVFSTAFGGGMSSRLFQELRERCGLCYTVFSQAGAYSDTGQFLIYAGTGADSIGPLSEKVIDELRRAAEGFEPAEIDRARAQIRSGLLMGLESPASRAERLARMLAIWDRVPDLSETLARIDAVDGAALRAFGDRLLSGDGPALALLGPISSAPAQSELADRLAA